MLAYATGDTGHGFELRAWVSGAATLQALLPGGGEYLGKALYLASIKTALGFEAMGSHSGPDQTGRCLSSKTELHRWKRTTATSESPGDYR